MSPVLIALLILIIVIIFTSSKEPFHSDGSSSMRGSGIGGSGGASVGGADGSRSSYDELVPYEASLGMSDAPTYLVDLYKTLSKVYIQSHEDAKFDAKNREILTYLTDKKLDWIRLKPDDEVSGTKGQNGKFLVETTSS